MAGNPEYQNLDSYNPPNPVTPADSPSNPAGYAMVTPHGRGPAPYDIQDSHDVPGEVQAAFDGANAVAGAGVLYPAGPRQQATAKLMNSPQGFAAGGGSSGWDITPGFSGEPGESWPNNPQP